MLFFNRSLLSQFSAITDKTAAQRFLDEHWHLYEDGRHYQRDSEAALNRGVGKFERMGAVHLPHNDLNREKYGDSFVLRYIKHGGKVFSVYAANFEYLVAFTLPFEILKESRNAHFGWATSLLLSDERYWANMSECDKIYMRRFHNPPYDTVWHHDVDNTIRLVRCGDHNQQRGSDKYVGKNIVHAGGISVWREIYKEWVN